MEDELRSQQIIKLLNIQKSLYEVYAKKYRLQGRSLQILHWLYYNHQGVTQMFLSKKTLLTK